METFKIEVKETLSRVIEIEANSADEAFSKTQKLYKNEEIVLDADDYVGVNFIDLKAPSPSDEKVKLIKEIIDYLYEDEKKHFEEFDSLPDNHIYLKINRLKELVNG